MIMMIPSLLPSSFHSVLPGCSPGVVLDLGCLVLGMELGLRDGVRRQRCPTPVPPNEKQHSHSAVSRNNRSSNINFKIQSILICVIQIDRTLVLSFFYYSILIIQKVILIRK